MSSYDEVRRVRSAMSEATGHDVRKLIAHINERRTQVASRIIDPGTKTERTSTDAESDALECDEGSPATMHRQSTQ